MSLLTLEYKVNKLLAKQAKEDWFPEDEGYLGISRSSLRKMRMDPKHADGWKCRTGEKRVSSDGKAVRRNIIWSKSYLFNLFEKP